MDVARDRARQYLKALPVRDRVMLVRADGMATPATAFEVDHKKVEDAIKASQPGSTALNLDQALVFARHIQGQDGHRVGEIAFIGPGRTAPRDPGTTALPRNLRVISIPDNVENVGLRKVGMRRSGADSGALGNLRGRAQLRSAAAHGDALARFRTSGAGGPRGGRVAPAARWRRGRSRKPRSNTAPAPRACWASTFLRTTAIRTTTMPNWNCRRSRRCR